MGEISKKNQERRSVFFIPYQEAEKLLKKQIQNGYHLLEMVIYNFDQLENARAVNKSWDQFNLDLLKRIGDTDELVKMYSPKAGSFYIESTSLEGQKKEYYADVLDKINKLKLIGDRLKLIYEMDHLTRRVIGEPEKFPSAGNKVFIVHGHDEAVKQNVARFLEKLGLEAIILHEQPNQGRTIIEKFEDYSGVGFAVVLLTPDDIGGPWSENPEDLLPRARQNVIFELGFMIGKLGRQRVCALHKGDPGEKDGKGGKGGKFEIPSDFSGVIWIGMDSEGAWQFKLARELKAAGFEVDLNRLI